MSVKKRIVKLIAFGGYDIETRMIDDSILTNNGETIKVLATIIKAIFLFFDSNPKPNLQIVGVQTQEQNYNTK